MPFREKWFESEPKELVQPEEELFSESHPRSSVSFCFTQSPRQSQIKSENRQRALFSLFIWLWLARLLLYTRNLVCSYSGGGGMNIGKEIWCRGKMGVQSRGSGHGLDWFGLDTFSGLTHLHTQSVVVCVYHWHRGFHEPLITQTTDAVVWKIHNLITSVYLSFSLPDQMIKMSPELNG